MLPAEMPSRTDTPSTSHSPGAAANPVYPIAASNPATASRVGTPRRRISGPTTAVTSTDPIVVMSRIRPRSPTGAPKVARMDGHAVPSTPSGRPRMTKLPRLSRSELRLAMPARRRCSPIGLCIRHRAGWPASWDCAEDFTGGNVQFTMNSSGGRRPSMATPNSDVDELAKFGYKQELDRSLGMFSSFAAGFSYISIMTGVFELFFFGFASGGPAFIWTWPAVFAGQFLVALCFAELAGQYPLAGSVYQWAKQVARPFTAWFGGWILSVGAIVTLAAVAVAYQVVAPQIWSGFQIIGGAADIGLVSTPDGAKNALLLAVGLVIFTTIINMVGVKTMARINNFGVAAELVGVTLLIILLAVHIRRSPAVIFDTFGTGAGHTWGYFGAFLVAGLMSAYVMYGFDTAGSLAEETLDPRKNAPPAILRALAAAGIAGLLVILFGLMSVPDIHAKELGTSGLPYLVKATFGSTIGNLFLIDSLIAITVCSLAVHAGGIRMIFTMGRDGRLPFASAIARVHGKSKTPLIPSIVIGVLTILLLVLNVSNQRAFFVLTSVAIIMFYIAYMCVTGPLLIARLRGKWPTPDHGPYFSLGRWGLVVNLLAVAFQILVMINLAWPRPAVYGADHWYFQWGAFTFTGLLGGVGIIYYLARLRGRPAAVLAEHRAAAVAVADEPA